MTSCSCKNCCSENQSGSSSSSFIFGIVLGAIIGAIIAILIYKNNKGQVFEQLKEKLEKYFQNLMGYEKPIKTAQPVKTETKIITKTPTIKKPAPKMFVKPKK